MESRILLADSSPVFRYGLENILKAEGKCEAIDHAENGEELEKLVTSSEYELVIIDCMAPNFAVDNVLHCQRIRPGLKMLAITAAHSGQSIVHALRAGITSYVKKDCSMEEVL